MLHALNYYSSILILALIVIFSLPHVGRAEIAVLPVASDKSVVESYLAFMAHQQVPVTEVTSLKSPYASRTVASLVVLQQALHLGGLNARLKFVSSPNSARERMMIRQGEVVVSSQDLWSTAFTDDVYMSSAVIPKGRFFKGVYGLRSNKALMATASLNQLRRFTPVSSAAWVVDWNTLLHLRFDNVRSVSRYDLMINLIRMQEADFIFHGFTGSKDMALKHNGVVLYPVPGIKIALEDSRHFMISKAHPDGKRTYDALERGLAIMRKQGTIERYLKEAGFYNPAVEDWFILNP